MIMEDYSHSHNLEKHTDVLFSGVKIFFIWFQPPKYIDLYIYGRSVVMNGQLYIYVNNSVQKEFTLLYTNLQFSGYKPA